MPKISILLFDILAGILIAFFSSLNSIGPTSFQNTAQASDLSVLKVSEGRDGQHFVLVLLVPPSLSKQEVISIVQSSMAGDKQKYQTVHIEVWNSRQAYENRLNDDYPWCEIVGHKLVEANRISSSGYNQIEWVPDQWAQDIAECRKSTIPGESQ